MSPAGPLISYYNKTMAGNHGSRRLQYILILLGVLLAVLAVFLFFQFRTIRHEQIMNAREHWFNFFLQRRGPLSPQNANLIQPWMTFDYINHLFNLPPAYLQSELHITDMRYPKLSVGGLAKDDNQTSTAAILTQVIDAVQSY